MKIIMTKTIYGSQRFYKEIVDCGCDDIKFAWKHGRSYVNVQFQIHMLSPCLLLTTTIILIELILIVVLELSITV